MRNPNNNIVPNLYIENREGAEIWMGKIKLRGLDKALEEPRKHLSRACAMFLEHEYERYKRIMNYNDLLDGVLEQPPAPTKEKRENEH